MKQQYKDLLISSLITFVTGIAVVLLTEIDSLTLESIQTGAWVGILFASVRAGVKAVLQLIVSKGIVK